MAVKSFKSSYTELNIFLLTLATGLNLNLPGYPKENMN